MKTACASMNRLPMFLQEYRTTMKYVDEKDGIIRLVFDEGEFSRGKPDGTTIHYSFRTQLFMEGEDISQSGSVRSRCLIITHSSLYNNGMEWVDKFIKENTDLLNAFAYSYYTSVNREEYEARIEEGYKLLRDPKVPTRILDNVVLMYAGTTAFCPDKSEEILKCCKDIMLRQIDDFKLNGE